MSLGGVWEKRRSVSRKQSGGERVGLKARKVKRASSRKVLSTVLTLLNFMLFKIKVFGKGSDVSWCFFFFF